MNAGGRTDTARVAVPCPPQVRRVAIVAAGADGGLRAQVRVTTANTRPVRLTVRFAAGERGGAQTVTLSGATSYSRSFSHPAKLPCGTRWSITAVTAPAAAGGAATRSGSTPPCPREEEPEPQSSPVPQDSPSKEQPPAEQAPSEETRPR